MFRCFQVFSRLNAESLGFEASHGSPKHGQQHQQAPRIITFRYILGMLNNLFLSLGLFSSHQLKVQSSCKFGLQARQVKKMFILHTFDMVRTSRTGLPYPQNRQK